MLLSVLFLGNGKRLKTSLNAMHGAIMDIRCSPNELKQIKTCLGQATFSRRVAIIYIRRIAKWAAKYISGL
jgi:hypothetical protein